MHIKGISRTLSQSGLAVDARGAEGIDIYWKFVEWRICVVERLALSAKMVFGMPLDRWVAPDSSPGRRLICVKEYQRNEFVLGLLWLYRCEMECISCSFLVMVVLWPCAWWIDMENAELFNWLCLWYKIQTFFPILCFFSCIVLIVLGILCAILQPWPYAATSISCRSFCDCLCLYAGVYQAQVLLQSYHLDPSAWWRITVTMNIKSAAGAGNCLCHNLSSIFFQECEFHGFDKMAAVSSHTTMCCMNCMLYPDILLLVPCHFPGLLWSKMKKLCVNIVFQLWGACSRVAKSSKCEKVKNTRSNLIEWKANRWNEEACSCFSPGSSFWNKYKGMLSSFTVTLKEILAIWC